MTKEQDILKVFEYLNSKYASSFDHKLLPDPLQNVPECETDTNNIRYNYYGNPLIIDLLNKASAGVCKDTEIYRWYQNLINLLQEKCSSWEGIHEKYQEVDEIRCNLSDYFQKSCASCTCEVCKNNLQEVLCGLPFEGLLFGLFSARLYRIELYKKSIETARPGEYFDIRFHSTLAHESFHAYHYQLCIRNGKDLKYWEEPLLEDPLKTVEFRRSILDILQPLTHKAIVKESLASYFEYYYDRRGKNPEKYCINYMNQLIEEWLKHTPEEWPYSGAAAFLGMNDIVNTLFEKVLTESLDDWEKAYQLIKNNWENGLKIKDFIIGNNLSFSNQHVELEE